MSRNIQIWESGSTYCERCGRTWLISELRDLLHPGRPMYTWSEVLEVLDVGEKSATCE